MNKTQDSKIPDLMRPKEAAKLLQKSAAWLARKRCEGSSLPYVKIGGRIFYERQELIDWLKRQKRAG